MENTTEDSLPYALVKRALSCSSADDDSFGPFVSPPCRDGFDFTLLFEQTILTILPACILLLWSPIRISRLWRSSLKTVSNDAISSAKLITTFANLGLQIALLVLWTKNNSPYKTRASVPAAAVSVLAAVGIVILSRLEHTRSIRPSSILNVYLFFSVLCDIAQTRTLYLLQNGSSITPSVFSAGLAVKLTLLLLEAQGKQSMLREVYSKLPPESTSGIWSQSLFWWLNRLIASGFKKLLTLDDLYDMDITLQSDQLCGSMTEMWERRSKPEGKLELVLTVFKTLKWPLLATVFPRLCVIGFQFAQPFLITSALELLLRPVDSFSTNEGYGLIAATCFIYTGIAVSTAQYQYRLYRSVTMFRGAMVAMIYNQALESNSDVYDEATSVTLMSTDIARIVSSIEEFHEIYARSIEVCVGTGLLARQLGWVCVIPLLVALFCSFLSGRVASHIGSRQVLWTQAVQRRIAMTTSCLGSMKSVRMLGYARIVSKILQLQRVRELSKQKGFRWMIVWMNVISNTPSFITPPLVFLVYALQAHFRGAEALNVTQAFTSLALISLLNTPMSRLLYAIPGAVASSGSIERVTKFLLIPVHKDDRMTPGRPAPSESSTSASTDIPLQDLSLSRSKKFVDVAIHVEDASITPTVKTTFSLKNVNLTFKRGSLSMVIGPVGCGKTTLLRAILGEIPCRDGNIFVSSSRMAYCSQSVWLQNRTVCQIITGSMNKVTEQSDARWFEQVVHACALKEDIESLVNGEDTVVGSKGTGLSGGQKQRIALARAVYSRQPIILLDDIFSALDASTERKIVDRLFSKQGLFQKLGTTVVLVTHASKFTAMISGSKLSPDQARYLNIADSIVVLSHDGSLIRQVQYKDLISDPTLFQIVKASEQHVESEDEKAVEKDSVVSKDVTNEDEKALQDLSRQTGDFSVYKYFFKHVSLASTLLYFAIAITTCLATIFPQLILNWWTEAGGRLDPRFLVPYCLLGIVGLSFAGASIWAMLILIIPEASIKIHHRLLKSVMGATQAFITKTDRGQTLNMFSQDMMLIDTDLAVALLVAFACLFETIAQGAMIALGSTFMALTIPGVLIGLYFLQYVYLRTSRQLRFLDLEAKSPLYTHFVETLDGAATIRAFGWQQVSKQTSIKSLDASQKPFYLLFCIQRWLNLVLDLIGMAVAVIVVALAMSLRASTTAGLLGIALNNILGFNSNLSQLVVAWTDLETSLGAVARVKNFERDTPQEAQAKEIEEAPSAWPMHGRIVLDNISASYGTTKALQDVSLTIEPGQKVGICGRTGSGKSSLLSTILRLLELDSGSIRIDDLDLAGLNRESIREHLIVVPQDAFALSGSVRLNADPLSTHDDESIISALQKVHLWDALVSRGGLDCNMDENPLSTGQMQLFSLARAILRSSGTDIPKVLLLDEATSNVDTDTDSLMQAIIREQFSKHTILTVAHRLETIMDADLVVVMEKGRVIESGNPKTLLQQKNSAFAVLNGRHST